MAEEKSAAERIAEEPISPEMWRNMRVANSELRNENDVLKHRISVLEEQVKDLLAAGKSVVMAGVEKYGGAG